jgi:hypothetical protein
VDIQATLSTMAEVAITLAGFNGLVIALAAKGHDTPQALFRVSAIVAACFVVVIAVLLPSGLVEAAVSEQMSFGIASIFLGVGFIVVGVCISIAGRKGIFVSSTPIFSLLLRIPSFVLAFFLILAPLFGWVSSTSILFVFSCFWFISVIGAYFILSILWVLQSQAAASEYES